MAESVSIGIELTGGEEVDKQLETTSEKISDVQKAAQELHDTDASIKVEAPGAKETEDQIKTIEESLKSAKTSADELGTSLQSIDGSNIGAVAAQADQAKGALDPISQTATIASAGIDAMQLSMHRAEAAFESLGVAATRMGARMTRSLGIVGVLARSFGPVGIAVAVVAGAFIKFGGDSADALNKLTTEAAKLGLTAQQLDTLQKAFGQLGVSSDAVTSNLGKLRETLGGGLFRLGDLVPPDATAGLQQFIAQLESMPDSVQRTQLAMQTLGESLGGEVIAGLQAGTISAQNFASALGNVTPATQQQIVEAAKYQQTINQLSAAWTELKAAFAPIVTPIFSFLTQEIKNLKKDIDDLIKQFLFAKAVFEVFKAGVKGEDIGAAAKKAAEEYKKATEVAKETKQGFGTVTSTLQQSTDATKNNTDATKNNTESSKDNTQATEGASQAKKRMAEAARQAAQAAAEEAAAQERYAQTFTDGINHVMEAYAKLRAGTTAVVEGGQFSGAILSVNDLARAYSLAAAEAERLANYSRYIAALPRPTSVPLLESQRPARLAEGGLLGGRGTGTSDSNLAWVSRGEHITPARAVAQPGVLAFLEALRRSGGNLRGVLDGMGRFALGGLVPRAMPAFAGGGPVGGMSHVTIQFPGLPPVGGLRASSAVVGELQKAAALAQVRSGGRKPSRYS